MTQAMHFNDISLTDADTDLNYDYQAPESEVWKSLPGFPGYEVSNLGRIKSLARTSEINRVDGAKYTRSLPERILSCSPYTTYGHLHTGLYRDGHRHTITLHAAVLTAFVGPRPEGMECRHMDGNPRNNRLDNLVWGTRQENAEDQIRHGTNHLRGRGRRLTRAQVVEIKTRFKEGKPVYDLSEKWGVSKAAVYHVTSGRNWAHVTV